MKVEKVISEALKSLECWKGLPSRTQFMNDVRYQMVEVSIVAIQEVIDLIKTGGR